MKVLLRSALLSIMLVLVIAPLASADGRGGVPELIYYQFENGDTEVANLASAPVGSNPATIAGLITSSKGLFGAALYGWNESSSTHYVDTGWPVDLGTGSWTISFAAIDFPSNPGTYHLFGSASNHFRCTLLDGTLILQGDGLNDVSRTGLYGIAAWTTFSFVYDATVPEIRLYQNAELKNTVAQSALDITSTDNLLVGGYSTENGMPGAGFMMDEFRIYNRALSAEEIDATYRMNLATPIWMTASSPTVAVGRPVTYTVHMSNNYPSAAITATVTDTLDALLFPSAPQVTLGPGVTAVPGEDASWSITNLAAGSEGVITVTGVLTTASIVVGLPYTNTAQALVSGTDYVLEGGARIDITAAPSGSADLEIAKSARVHGLDGITYTVVATNNGPDDAAGAVISDTLPAEVTGVTWTSVGAGGAVGTASGCGNIADTLTAFPSGGVITYTLSGTLTEWGGVSNTAEVIIPSGMEDTDTDNNSATIRTYVLDLPLVWR